MSRQIKEIVEKCPECARVKESAPQKEPLLTSRLPEYPWQKVAVRSPRSELPLGSRLFFQISRSS